MAAVKRAKKEGVCCVEIFPTTLQIIYSWAASLNEVLWRPAGLDENLHGYKELKEFIGSLKKPR